jgi:CRP/FNR family transcriptional regulator, polysaccharide utilization system transcription regulator
MNHHGNCMKCRESSDIFNVLGADELIKIDECRISLSFKSGEVIFKQGAPCHNFVCITSGLVKLYIEHQNDRNSIIGLLRPVNYIFEPGFFVDQVHHFTAVAAENSTACLIDIGVMKELILENSYFANELIKKISRQALGLFGRISSCTQKHVYGRVADTLLSLNPAIYPQNPFELTISRQDLADLSGMTKESLIRVMKKFKDDGIISLDGTRMEILNRKNLEIVSMKG